MRPAPLLAASLTACTLALTGCGAGSGGSLLGDGVPVGAATAAPPASTPDGAASPTDASPTPDAVPTTEAAPTAPTTPTAPAAPATTATAPSPGPGVPVVATPALPTPSPKGSKPGSKATPQQQLDYELATQTVRTAGVSMRTGVVCAPRIDFTKSVKSTCTVTYAGKKVAYAVTVKGGTIVGSFRATTTKGVLVRSAVLAARANSGGFAEELDPRCDVPMISLVTLGQPTGATCTYRLKVDPDTVRTDDVVLEAGQGPDFRPR